MGKVPYVCRGCDLVTDLLSMRSYIFAEKGRKVVVEFLIGDQSTQISHRDRGLSG